MSLFVFTIILTFVCVVDVCTERYCLGTRVPGQAVTSVPFVLCMFKYMLVLTCTMVCPFDDFLLIYIFSTTGNFRSSNIFEILHIDNPSKHKTCFKQVFKR